MQNVKIMGTGIYLPELVVTNGDLSQMMDTSDEWIQTRTGISTRHISRGETAWQMGVKAARQALDAAGLTGKDIQAIIGTTISPDFYYPSLACVVSRELGAIQPLAVDLSAACSGFVYGIDLARRYLMDDDIQNVLLVSSEVLSKQTDYTDRSTCILFGDGAGAMVLTKGEGLFASYLKSENRGMEFLCSKAHPVTNPWAKDAPFDDFDGVYPHNQEPHLYMEGREVYKFAVKALPDALEHACEKAGIAPQELDLIIPHQANLRIIEGAMKRMKIDMSKVYHNIERYGNTSSASISIGIHECLHAGILKKGHKVGLVGFGAGLTFAGCVLEIC